MSSTIPFDRRPGASTPRLRAKTSVSIIQTSNSVPVVVAATPNTPPVVTAPIATVVVHPPPQQQHPHNEWKDSDVHHWSNAMRQVLEAEWPSLPQESRDAEARSYPPTQEMKQAMPADVLPVLEKFVQRHKNRDSDLCQVQPYGLFAMAWEEPHLPKEALYDCMRDIGMTCLQGDTHRLFSLLLAHRRSCAENALALISPPK